MAGPFFQNRVRETSTTTGQGSITLAGAVTGYQSFATAIAINDNCYYVIANQTGTEWEVGIGTLTASSSFRRDRILSSSNSNLHVNFSVGTKDVFIDMPAEYVNDAVNAVCLTWM